MQLEMIFCPFDLVQRPACRCCSVRIQLVLSLSLTREPSPLSFAGGLMWLSALAWAPRADGSGMCHFGMEWESIVGLRKVARNSLDALSILLSFVMARPRWFPRRLTQFHFSLTPCYRRLWMRICRSARKSTG